MLLSAADLMVLLYIEDEENDVLLLKCALEHDGIGHRLIHIGDGEEAIDYLAGRGQYADRGRFPPPDCVLLDLNLPRKSGFEVLEWMRHHGGFGTIPVLICTSSDLLLDRDEARRFGATGYAVKDADFSDVVRAIQQAIGEGR